MIDRFKFRVWDTRLKEYNAEHTYCLFEDGDLGEYDGVTPIQEWYIIEQCTGLKDKNGNLIYEGDIVRFEIVDDDSVLGKTFERTCEICFGGGDYPYSFVCKNIVYCRGYALLSSVLGQKIESVEIISNIHEQAEQKGK